MTSAIPQPVPAALGGGGAPPGPGPEATDADRGPYGPEGRYGPEGPYGPEGRYGPEGPEGRYGPEGPEGPYYYPAQPDRLGAFFLKIERRTPRWVAPLALAGCCAAASAWVLWRNPTELGAGAVPTCLVKLTTGFDCPGCGGTRALWFLLHGDLPAAAQHHILAVFAAPFLIYAYVAWVAGTVFRRPIPQLRLSLRTVGIALAVWGVFTVLRNLPFEPFSWFYV